VHDQVTKTRALGLLGALASVEIQRRYIVEASKVNYLDPEKIVEDAFQFVKDPRLGDANAIGSVDELSCALEELPPKIAFDDFWFSTKNLVERNEEWDQLRRAARRVLNEIGADLEAWVRQEVKTRGT
jgi:hypothetical protein